MIRNLAIIILWSFLILFAGTSLAASSASLSMIVTLDPIIYDLTAGTEVYEAAVENEFSSSPSGSLVPFIEGSQPTEIGALIEANIAYLQSQGLDTVYVFPIEGGGQLWVNSPTLLSLVHGGFNYDSGQTTKKKYVLVADLLDEIVAAAHTRSMQVVANIESLAHIINRSASSGIGGEAGTQVLADDLPPPTITQVNAFIDELLAYGVDVVAAEAFSTDYDQAIATKLANASIPYWRTGADIGDVWSAYHYSTYPTVRDDTKTYNYLHTMDSLLGQTNGGIHARARVTGNNTLLTVGAYNPLPCDLSLVESDLYSENRSEFIDAEIPALADGTLVDNCATAFWRNIILFGVLGQNPSGILVSTDMAPSIAAGLDPSTAPAILARIDEHPFRPASEPIANIILDRPAYDEDLDGIAAQDFIDGMLLSILPLVSDALDAAGFQTVLTYDAPYTASTPALTYILTAGGNESTYAGDLGSGPPTYSTAKDIRAALVPLLDIGNHPGPVFVHPVVGIPAGTGDGESLPGWGAVRAQFGLPNRFAYNNPQSSSDTTYHTSRVFSALVDAAGEVAIPPGQAYIVPASGQLNGATVRLEPWFDVFEIGQFANLLQPDSGADNVDAARISASGPLLLPQGHGSNPMLMETSVPYLLNDGNGRYLWLINQLHQDAFVWLLANEAATAAGLTPPLIAPARAHINGGEQFMALAYDQTTVQFAMPVPDGTAVRVRIYDQRGDRITDDNVTYNGSISYSLQKRSLLVAEPASFIIDTSAAAPITGLWWNQLESGWGVALTQQFGIIFVTLYTYDDQGNPYWYVASNCAISGASCTGKLYEVTGGEAITATWKGNSKADEVGNVTITFTDNNTGTMNFTINGVSGTKTITRQVFSTPSPAAAMNGLFWNPNESGWGVALTQQTNIVFATMYTYDANGVAYWYVASNCVVSGSGCTGELYQVTGVTTLVEPFSEATKVVTQVGNVEFLFDTDDSGTMTFDINGVEGSKQITRQIWATQ